MQTIMDLIKRQPPQREFQFLEVRRKTLQAPKDVKHQRMKTVGMTLFVCISAYILNRLYF